MCGACVCTAAALLAHSANIAFMRTTLACSLCKYDLNGKNYMENETILQFFSMSSLQFHITVELNIPEIYTFNLKLLNCNLKGERAVWMDKMQPCQKTLSPIW